jgi:two-component system CheB/CheR fusion protein
VRPHSRGGVRADLHRETDAAILRRYAPPGVVVDADWTVLLSRGPVGPYVDLQVGHPRQNLAHLVRPELLPEIRRLVDVAVATGRPARGVPIRVRRTHGSGVVDIDVLPITWDRTRCWLVTFEESVGRTIAAQDADAVHAQEVARLQREVELLRGTLGASLREREEELEAAREEIRSLGEQYHATYEDLARAKRELETSADELHRRNLEIWTMQAELQALFQAVDVPIVVLGAELEIRWATPSAEALFHVRPGDVGRPLAEVRQALDLDDLEGRIRSVVAAGGAQRLEARDGAGRRWAIVVRALLGRDGAADGAVVLALDLDVPAAAR